MLYGLACIVFVIFSYAMFPLWRGSVSIPVIGLVGIGAWLYGTTKGLALIMPILVYHYILYSEIYADLYVYYENRVLGTLLMIFMAWFSGTLKYNHDAIQRLNVLLEKRIQRRNKELNQLAAKLIDNTERLRSALGEELHNGVGQALTGIQLYSSTLADQLYSEQDASSSLGYSLRTRAAKAHHLVRSASRTLFPVQIGETGFMSAFHELAACLKESKQTEITIIGNGEEEHFPEGFAIQLFRICQESILYLQNCASATNFTVEISTAENNLKLEIAHDGHAMRLNNNQDIDVRLLDFRLQQILGTAQNNSLPGNLHCLTFSLPLPDARE